MTLLDWSVRLDPMMAPGISKQEYDEIGDIDLFVPEYFGLNTHVTMRAMASQITSLTIAYSIVYSGADQRKRQISASLVFVRGIHRWQMNSPSKGSVKRKMFSFDDVIMRIAHSYIIPVIHSYSAKKVAIAPSWCNHPMIRFIYLHW